MSQEKFDEIITFAIEREAEAVKFYQDLQKMVKFSSQKKLLHQFEKMELQHIAILENIRRLGLPKLNVPEVTDLQISDYLVESVATSDMSFEDIIVIAMKREAASYKLYTSLAGRAREEEIQKLFLRLAAEEAQHKLHFETMYDEEVLTQN